MWDWIYVQWQWKWEWKLFIAKITQIEALIIQDHDSIINDNVGKQAQWYHNFGKGGRSRYVCAPSSCIQYDSYVCDEQENRVQGSGKSEYNLDSNDLRAFMIIPVPLVILREMHFTCSSQFSLSSIIAPKNFALSTSRIRDPFIWMVGHCSFLLIGLKIMKFVLSILRDNRFAFNHLIMLPSSLLMTVDNLCKFFDLQNNVVSSANKTEKRTRETEAISFMYNRNNNGPSIESCGTPQVICFTSDEVSL